MADLSSTEKRVEGANENSEIPPNLLENGTAEFVEDQAIVDDVEVSPPLLLIYFHGRD